jgi:hypothetical protein
MQNAATRLKKSPGIMKLQLSHWIIGILLIFIAVVVICIVILAGVPPVSRDALIHHLSIPKLYLQHGGIYEIPYAKWSYYPMNLDLLYIIPLYFGNDIIPKYIHFAFALLTALLIFRYLKTRLNVIYALLGVVVFLSLPIIVKLSITAYVDLGIVFFSFAALFYFLKWVNHEYKLKFLLISAFWCGLGLGTKYNGLIVLFLLTLFAILNYNRNPAVADKRQIKAIGFGIVFMLVAIIVFSPWAIRNYVWTQNPIYPLYNSWFNGKNEESVAIATGDASNGEMEGIDAVIGEKKESWGHFAIRKIIFNEKGWEIALVPIRIFFQGRDDDPKYFDGRLNPLLFLLPLVAFFYIIKDPARIKNEKKILFWFSTLFILYAFFQTDMRIRYISPAIPPLVVLAMFGLNDLMKALNNQSSEFFRKSCLVLLHLTLGFLLCLNAVYIIDQFQQVSPLSFILGHLDRDAYIEKYRPDYAAIQFANKAVPDKGIILGVFLGNRSYYSNRQMRFDYNRFLLTTIRHNLSAEAVAANLRKAGITHLIVRYDLFNQWIENNFNENQKETFARLLNDHMDLVFMKAGHGVYQLRAF